MMYGLSDSLITRIISVLESNRRIESAVLFGSRAKGNFKPGSDVDLAIKGDEFGLKDVLDIQNQFDEEDQPYNFDIVIYKNITEPSLTDHIDRVGIEIYRKTGQP